MNVLTNKYYARIGLLSYGKHTLVKYYARIGNIGTIPPLFRINLNPTIVHNFSLNYLHISIKVYDLI